MDLHGFARVCKVLQGFASVCKGLQGFARVCKGLQGFARVFKGLQGFARVCKGLQRLHWCAFHMFAWIYIGLLKINHEMLRFLRVYSLLGMLGFLRVF